MSLREDNRSGRFAASADHVHCAPRETPAIPR